MRFEIAEAGLRLQEGEAHQPGRAVTLLRDIDLGNSLVLRLHVRILVGAEEEHDEAARRAARAEDRDGQGPAPSHAADRAQAARAPEEEQQPVARDRDARSTTPPAPHVEDQTLVELRQSFAPENGDDGIDMGI